MDTQHHDPILDIQVLEHKADELISLMFSLCEEELRRSAMPDARATSLIHAVMAVRTPF
jgi:hypothetical protein